MQGLTLINTLIQQTGLPSEYVESKLLEIIKKRNLSPENISLNSIREVLSEILMQTFEELAQDPSQ